MSFRLIYKYIIFFVTALVGFATGGCVDDFDYSLSPSLARRALDMNFNSGNCGNLSGEGFNEQVNINTESTPWAFNAKPSWVSIAPSAGTASTTATLTGERNESGYDSRSGMLVLASQDPQWIFERRYQLTQQTANQWVEIDNENRNLQFSGAAFERIIPVKSNCYWRIEKSNSPWLSVVNNGDSKAGQGGYISISATTNNSGATRSATIDIYSANGVKQKGIYITQANPQFELSQTQLNAVNGASKYQLSITSDIAWEALPMDSWIKVTPMQGNAGTTMVEVEIAESNSVSVRNGTVNFRYLKDNGLYGYLASIAIHQDRVYLEVENGSTCTFDPRGSSTNIKLRSNTNWSVSSLPAWITMSELNGVGDANLTITASENLTSSKRSGSIVFSKPGVSLSYSLNVEQDCQSLSLSMTQLEFGDRGSSQEFEITSTANWSSSIQATGGWLSTNVSNGSGNSTIRASVTENNSTIVRSGSIDYAWPSGSTSVQVRQQPKYLSVSDQSLNFGSTGGNHLLDVTTNDRWTLTAEGNPTWLTLSKTSGNGTDQVSINIADNPSINPRSARVILNTENSGGAILIFNQRPRLLELSMASVYMYDRGGVSSPITVSTDGTYSIEASDTWFRAIPLLEQGKDVYQVTVDPSPERKIRQGELRFSLTNLREGSLTLSMPIVQLPEGGTYILNGYTKDIDWNICTKDDFSHSGFGSDNSWTPTGSINVGKNGYSSDKQYDKSEGNWEVGIRRYMIDTYWGLDVQGKLNVSTSGFSTDKDWGRFDGSNSYVTLLLYGVDKNWSNQNSHQALINMLRYGTDIEYCKINLGGSINRFPYHRSDKDYNCNSNTSGNINKNGYGSDKDYNQDN